MQSFFVASVFLFALSFGTKGVVHLILDVRNGHKIDLTSARGFVYFLPYDRDVSEKDEKLKIVCNLFQKLSMLFLVIFIVAHFFFFFYKK
jgi:hypothetical protein